MTIEKIKNKNECKKENLKDERWEIEIKFERKGGKKKIIIEGRKRARKNERKLKRQNERKND